MGSLPVTMGAIHYPSFPSLGGNTGRYTLEEADSEGLDPEEDRGQREEGAASWAMARL